MLTTTSKPGLQPPGVCSRAVVWSSLAVVPAASTESIDGAESAPLGAAREDARQWTADWELRARLIFKRTLGPSWSVRRLAAPRSAGAVVSRAHRTIAEPTSYVLLSGGSLNLGGIGASAPRKRFDADSDDLTVWQNNHSRAADDATFHEQLLCGCQRRIHVVLAISDGDTAGKLPMA